MCIVSGSLWIYLGALWLQNADIDFFLTLINNLFPPVMIRLGRRGIDVLFGRSGGAVFVIFYRSHLIDFLYLCQSGRQLLHCLWVEYAIISFPLVSLTNRLLNGYLLIDDKIILLVFNILLLNMLEIWLYLKFARLFFIIFSSLSCFLFFLLWRRTVFVLRTSLHFIWICHSITLEFKSSTWWHSICHFDRLTVFLFMSHWLNSKGHRLSLFFNDESGSCNLLLLNGKCFHLFLFVVTFVRWLGLVFIKPLLNKFFSDVWIHISCCFNCISLLFFSRI